MNASPPIPKRHRIWRWLRRIAMGLVAAIVILAVAGFAYQTIATAQDERAYPPPGQMIVINGHAMHIHCIGDIRMGTPTVILEAGNGLTSPAWTLVSAKIAPTTRVCAYDRAGNGWSAPGPRPRDAATIAKDLHALLAAAGIAPPYVLAGHSIGGIYVRAYADAYPEEVVGLAVMDSTHPDQLTRSPTRSAAIASVRTLLRTAPFLGHFGVVRLTGATASPALDMPAREQAEMTAFGARPSQTRTMFDELAEFPANAETVHSAKSLGAMPLFVLSAGTDTDPDWPVLQNELAGLSTNVVHRTLPETDHIGFLFTKAGAETTGNAILAVVESARTNSPLVR